VEFDLDSRFLSLLHRKVTCNSPKSKKSNPCKLATASKASKSDPCKLATAPKAQKVTLASLQQLQKHKK